METKNVSVKERARKEVTSQLIAMLYNNILCDNGFEEFDGWCQNGEVFELLGLDEETQNECMALVNKIKDKVNDIAWELETITRQD